MKYTVEQEYVGSRLDIFLSVIQNEYSRSYVKNQINSNHVKVNGEIEFKANYKVKEGDNIEIDFVPVPAINIEPEKMNLDIVYEDDDLIVINKEVGMVVHPATGNWTGTLMNGLIYYYQTLGDVGDHVRSGLIHRLDKDTSGIILVGKTNKGLWHYSKQFAEREVKKSYLAMVVGDIRMAMETNKIVIKNYLGRHPVHRKKFTVVDPEKGKYAETEIKFIKSFLIDDKRYSLVEAKPKTGRTHQIRVHLVNMGFPILGDPIYSRTKHVRLMLHAWKLQIRGLDGNIHKFEAPIPKEFLLD